MLSTMLQETTIELPEVATMCGRIELPEVAAMCGRKRTERNHVKFAPEDQECFPSYFLTQEEIKSRWYQKSELIVFRGEIRDYIRRNGLAASSTSSPGTSASKEQHQSTPSEVVETRGYERHTLERSRIKRMSIRCVLRAYKIGMGEDKVALISRKCSSWAHKDAFKIAFTDYCEVYHPDLLIATTKQTSKKRGLETSSGSRGSRCVRARAC